MNLTRIVATALVALPLTFGGASAQSSDPLKTLVIAVPSDPVNLEPGTNKAEHMTDNLQAGRGRMPDAAMRARMVEFIKSLG